MQMVYSICYVWYMILRSARFFVSAEAMMQPRRDTPWRWVVVPLSGSCRCTIMGVPWCLRRLSLFSTFSTCLNMCLTDKLPQARHAETDPPPWHTYDGILTTSWVWFVLIEKGSERLQEWNSERVRNLSVTRLGHIAHLSGSKCMIHWYPNP